MIVVNFEEAEKTLENLIDMVLSGERVFISIKDEPVVELVPVNKNSKSKVD